MTVHKRLSLPPPLTPSLPTGVEAEGGATRGKVCACVRDYISDDHISDVSKPVLLREGLYQ